MGGPLLTRGVGGYHHAEQASDTHGKRAEASGCERPILTYSNGAEPVAAHFTGIDPILVKSAENGYRMLDTIAAVMDNALFRGSDWRKQSRNVGLLPK